MGQPIRKNIQEIHSDIIEEEPIYTLLIDGGSLLFLSMADDKINDKDIHYGGIYQFLLQMRMMMQKKDFDYIYVFFDNEYSGWIRWSMYAPYKANRDKHYADYGLSDYAKKYNENLKKMQEYLFNKGKQKENINSRKKSGWEDFVDANFDRERDTLMRYFEEMYVRCYMDEVTEGDDLIAYYCKNKKKNEKIIIMSGDMDLCQLLAEDVAIYNLKKKKFITDKNFVDYFGYHPSNVLIKKIFCGDVSDNIGNIKGLSETGFAKLIPEYERKPITVDDVKERAKELITERINAKKKPLQVHENIINGVSNKTYGGDFYDINEKIINLKKPLLSNEAKDVMDGMMYAPIDPEGRSFKNVYTYIQEDGIVELSSDTNFSSFFRPFKRLEEKELERYKKN